jgi:hypothetical protein
MKWWFAIFLTVFSSLVLLILLKKTQTNKPQQVQVIDSIIVTRLTGEKLIIKGSDVESNLILNHYNSECSLCVAEVNDILTYSKLERTKVLFLSVELLAAIQAFSSELKQKNVDSLMVSFARIDSTMVISLFGDFSTPKTILFKEGLKPVKSINGLATYREISKGFE